MQKFPILRTLVSDTLTKRQKTKTKIQAKLVRNRMPFNHAGLPQGEQTNILNLFSHIYVCKTIVYTQIRSKQKNVT